MRTFTKKPSIPPSVQKYVGRVWGQWAPGDRIPVDTPMHSSQRDYKKQNVYRYIAKVQGLDRTQFQYVTAICRESDKERQNMAVIDGQHRINLVKIVDPTTKAVPAHVIIVPDDEFDKVGAHYFVGLNAAPYKKTISNEDYLWSAILSEEPDALRMKRILEQCGLSCGRVNQGNKNSPVKYADFNKCLKLGEDITVRAVEILKKAFGRVSDIPLHGMVFLFSIPEYRCYSDPSTREGSAFEDWMIGVGGVFGIGELQQAYKEFFAGQYQKGMAYGYAKSFRKWATKHSRQHVPVTTIKRIYEKGIKKVDDEKEGLL